MHVRFVFAMYLTDVQLAIFRIGANLIVGAGVGWSLVMIDTDNTFGFNGSLLQPFNNGVFDPYPPIYRVKKKEKGSVKMAIPVVQEPLYLFERPFANEGTKTSFRQRITKQRD